MQVAKVGVLLLGMAVTAHAQTSVDELARLQGQTVLLKARLEKAKAEADLRKTTEGIASASLQPAGMPVVSGVYGRGERVFAQFLYANGMIVEAREGDTIPGGYRVTDVSVDHVWLSRRGERLQAGFSAVPPPLTDVSGATTGARAENPKASEGGG